MNAVTFKTKLESNIIKLFNIGNLIGKDVIITIVEIPQSEKHRKKRKWHFIGVASFNGKLDKTNIRDLAYE